jgi:tRNA A37 methylthiotransferase MiaB
MSAIVLSTLNAKWIHASFGLRCLLANLGELRADTTLVEATIADRTLDVAERILAHAPRIVGLGVYVWNVHETERLVATLKRIAPNVVVVLGGPEVSHETEQQRVCDLADHVIRGEGDVASAALCRTLLAGDRPPRVVDAPPPDLATLASPYDMYDATDVAHRVVYVEASRGCPFACEFCLSSLDERVRPFPLTTFLDAMERLLARGLRHFKFVDRTFNLSIATSTAILEFFLARVDLGLFLHFEMIPDRLPDALRALLARFPAGTVQLEVGIQTFDDATSERISRRQDVARIETNLRFLREHTGVHVHADLIAGLPGEDLTSFARGFDRLVALRPHEIQVGILKRLRGTPIVRHDAAFGMQWAEHAPYEILATAAMPFAVMQRVRRFARVVDLVVNSGNFTVTLPLLWADGSPFAALSAFTDALHERFGALHGVALHRLAEALFEHLQHIGRSRADAGRALFADYQRTRPNDWPEFLREYAGEVVRRPAARATHNAAASRQARHG